MLVITVVPTSERTAEQAQSLGIPLTTLATERGSPLGVAFDGAGMANLKTSRVLIDFYHSI